VQAFLQLYPKRQQMTDEEWEDVVRDWNGQIQDGALRPYAPIVVFYIRKYILQTV